MFIFFIYIIYLKNVYNNTIYILYEPTRNLIDSEVKKKICYLKQFENIFVVTR